MPPSDDLIPQQPVTVTLQIPAERQAEFEQLLSDFTSSKVRAIAPAFDPDAHAHGLGMSM